MGRSKNEAVGSDWAEMARDYAKAEKELRIEKWVRIVIGYHNAFNEFMELFRYDLPREVYERHRWIVRWRCSRLQCAYPKEYVACVFNYYDRRTGLILGMKSCLSKLTAAKAQVTKAKRCIENYVTCQTTKYPLFGYDESSDPVLINTGKNLQKKSCGAAKPKKISGYQLNVISEN